MKIIKILIAVALFNQLTYAQVPSYVPTNGLVAYYPFNGNANDVSANGNSGINYGATPTTDRNGTTNSAMNFNGVNNYISIPYSTTIGVQQEITVSFWVLFNGGGCSPRIMQSSPWGQCGGFTIATSSTSNSSRYFYTNFENCIVGVLSPTSPSLSGLTWHHVVWSASGLTGISKMYFDGVLVDTDFTSGFFTSINYFNRPITIGNIDATSCDWFGGKLDDIGVWNRALTQAEITALYNSTLSISSDTYNYSINIYPNPVVNNLNIKTENHLINQPYTIIDGLGRVVLNGKLNDVDTTINVEQLSKGIYYLKIAGNTSNKFIKE